MKKKLIHALLSLAGCTAGLLLPSCETEIVTGDVFECELEMKEAFYNNDTFTFKLKTNRSNILFTKFELSEIDEDIYPSGFALNTSIAVSSGEYVFTTGNIDISTPVVGHLSFTVKDPNTEEEKSFSRSFHLYMATGVEVSIIQKRNATNMPFNGDAIKSLDIETDDIIYGGGAFTLRFETELEELFLKDIDFEFNDGAYPIGKTIRPVKGVFTWDISDPLVKEDWLVEKKPKTMRFTFLDTQSGEEVKASCGYYTLRRFDAENATVNVANGEIIDGDLMRLHIEVPARENFVLSGIKSNNLEINDQMSEMRFVVEGGSVSSSQKFTLQDHAIDIVSSDKITVSADDPDVYLTVTLKDSDYSNASYEFTVPCSAYKTKKLNITKIVLKDDKNSSFRINYNETKSIQFQVLPYNHTEEIDVYVNGERIIMDGQQLKQIDLFRSISTKEDKSTGIYTLTLIGGEPGGEANIVVKSRLSNISCPVEGYVRHKAAIVIMGNAWGHDIKEDSACYPASRFYNFPVQIYAKLCTWNGESPDITDYTTLKESLKPLENVEYGLIKAQMIIKANMIVPADGWTKGLFWGWRSSYNGTVENGYLPSSTDISGRSTRTYIGQGEDKGIPNFNNNPYTTDVLYFVSSKTNPEYPVNQEEYNTYVKPFSTANAIKNATANLDYRESMKNTLFMLQDCNSDAKITNNVYWWSGNPDFDNAVEFEYNKWQSFRLEINVNSDDYNKDILDLRYVIHSYRKGDKKMSIDDFKSQKESETSYGKYWWTPFEKDHYTFLEDLSGNIIK